MPASTGGNRLASRPGRCAALAATAAIAAAGTLAGCTRPGAPADPISVGSAYVIEAGGRAVVDAYLVIRNNGGADHLLRASSSAGGTVVLRGPVNPHSMTARQVSQLTIPAHTLLRLLPSGIHLVILNSGPIRQGRYITLTLVFSGAGRLQVSAQVTNLDGKGGGSGYNDPGD
jgi:copper(I)-binding protein